MYPNACYQVLVRELWPLTSTTFKFSRIRCDSCQCIYTADKASLNKQRNKR